MNVLDELTRRRVIPLVVSDSDSAETAGALGDALAEGGLPIAEITLRTPAALTLIRRVADRGDVLVGAGTVVSPDQVDRAAEAGARFIVSPGIDENVVRRAQALGLVVIPGAITPTEIMTAMRLGLSSVKFYPASVNGGAAAVDSLSATFPTVTFIPTGGITMSTMPEYMAVPAVAAVGGSWMVPRDAIERGDAARISALVSRAVRSMTTRTDHPSATQEDGR